MLNVFTMQKMAPDWKAKCWEWSLRYGPAEICGTITAYLGFFAVNSLFEQTVISAFGGALCENLGYYLMIWWMRRKTSAQTTTRLCIEILTEFGPSEILDSFLMRPLCLALGAHWFGPGLGVLFGKLAGDVLFYIPVIATYEFRKRKRAAAS